MVALNSTLSEQEKRNYIRQSDGNLFVEAGAGAGKTTFISKRIINQMKKGVRPQEFVFITFTNEATIELYEKIEKNIVREMKKASSMEELSQLAYALEQLPEMNIMTIYRFCYGLLVQAGKAEGIREADFVSSEGMNRNNRNITKRCRLLLEENADFLEKVRKRFRHIYVDEFQDTDENQAAVLLLVAGERIIGKKENSKEAWVLTAGKDKTAWTEKEKTAETEKDSSNESVRENKENRTKHVGNQKEELPDKTEIGKILSGNPSSYRIRDDALFFVGDARQSIYRDEGAEVGIFCKVRDYMKGLQNAELISLEENYRSEEEILNWVNSHFENSFENYTAMKGDWIIKDKESFHGIMKLGRNPDNPVEAELWRLGSEEKQQPLISIVTECCKDSPKSKTNSVYEKSDKDRRLLIALIKTLFQTSACYLEEKDAGTPRDFLYSDFLVLVMREENIETYVDTLTKAGIPAITTGKFSIEKNENAVRVMTLKKAKGLAGNIVIVADRSVSKKEYFENIGEEEDFTEWKRFEYVAATRARHALIFMPELCSDTEFSAPEYKL